MSTDGEYRHEPIVMSTASAIDNAEIRVRGKQQPACNCGANSAQAKLKCPSERQFWHHRRHAKSTKFKNKISEPSCPSLTLRGKQNLAVTSTLGSAIARLPEKLRVGGGQAGRLRQESARVDPAREDLLASRKGRWESHPPTRNSSV